MHHQKRESYKYLQKMSQTQKYAKKSVQKL